jgi:hypothetical protein
MGRWEPPLVAPLETVNFIPWTRDETGHLASFKGLMRVCSGTYGMFFLFTIPPEKGGDAASENL